MNIAYVYLQLYRLFDHSTPMKVDCGRLCGSACCKGDDAGMYLFPGEENVYRLLKSEWAKIEKSDFYYEYGGKKKNVPLLICDGECDRYERPLACRIFPLTPYIDKSGKLEIIMDPRARSLCPLSRELSADELDYRFISNVKRAFVLLMKNAEVREYMKRYSEYIDEYRKFFE